MLIPVAVLILAPFVGFLINSFVRWKVQWAGWTGCIACFASFISSIYLLVNYSGDPVVVSFFPWLSWDALTVRFSFLIDSLSLMMILIITGVSFLIHLFSMEYMAEDDRPARYFSYLNLFLFNMLILVLADNLLFLFVGWEGVGLCSYLLIGFWFKDKAKAAAGMKAFITNRIGDAGFLIGLFLFFILFGSLDFLSINKDTLSQSSSLLITLSCLFLFVGAIGKSAQIPLYVWLPDAMAGPTPVSALIHAATMVTAGIYLIIRTNVMWMASPLALQVVAIIGVVTGLLGSYLACQVWDIKKILAYSTISQLGYMFLALGIGAFSSALFHLMTHAFFKACLFLSAGSLIHGLHGEQDIRNMGNLRKKMPVSFWSFLIGSLALMGIPPLSGFFSKDEILYHTFVDKHYMLWTLALIGAGFTAFYTTKLLYFVFWKKETKQHHPHEGQWKIKTPLISLAVLSVFAGVLNWPGFMMKIVPYHWLDHWLFISSGHQEGSSHLLEIILAVGSALFVALISGITIYFLSRNKTIPSLSWILKPCWSLDNFYNKYFVNGTVKLSYILFHDIETNFIQRGILYLNHYFRFLRKVFTSFQSGYLNDYILFMGAGFLLFIVIVLL